MQDVASAIQALAHPLPPPLPEPRPHDQPRREEQEQPGWDERQHPDVGGEVGLAGDVAEPATLLPSIFDLWAMLGFGAVGILLVAARHPRAPVAIGVIHGPFPENDHRRALPISREAPWICRDRPISAILRVIDALPIIGVMVHGIRQARHRARRREPVQVCARGHACRACTTARNGGCGRLHRRRRVAVGFHPASRSASTQAKPSPPAA